MAPQGSAKGQARGEERRNKGGKRRGRYNEVLKRTVLTPKLFGLQLESMCWRGSHRQLTLRGTDEPDKPPTLRIPNLFNFTAWVLLLCLQNESPHLEKLENVLRIPIMLNKSLCLQVEIQQAYMFNSTNKCNWSGSTLKVTTQQLLISTRLFVRHIGYLYIHLNKFEAQGFANTGIEGIE